MWIIVCIVLHNILLDLNNTWDQEEVWWSKEKQDKYDKHLFQLSQQDEEKGINMY